MKLRLERQVFTDESTIGELSVDGRRQCFTLEDRVREGPKVAGRTAIPAGTYEIAITFSQRFQRPLPLLLGVPGFSGVRIHAGNRAGDTDGCILVGELRARNLILHSQRAFRALFTRLTRAAKWEKLFIEVVPGLRASAVVSEREAEAKRQG